MTRENPRRRTGIGGGVADDPGADDLLVAGGMGIGQSFELSPVGGGQRDLACASDWHGRAFAGVILSGGRAEAAVLCAAADIDTPQGRM